MNEEKGILAFLGTIMAVACVLSQIPVVEGMTTVGQWFDQKPLPSPDPLALYFHPAGFQNLAPLAELRADLRPDLEIARLARKHGLTANKLKAHLAITSKGASTLEGMFWPQLPDGHAQGPDEGLARTRAAAKLLGRYLRTTGSELGAYLAWQTGPLRAGRTIDRAPARIDQVLAAMRLHLLAYHRKQALWHLCSVQGLASALDALWPASSRAAMDARARSDPGARVDINDWPSTSM